MNDLMETLYKKAKGYTVEETQDEYAPDEGGGQKLIRRKVAGKYIPPDLAALKTYMEMTADASDYERMTDAELEKERKRIINKVKEKDTKK